MTLARRSPPLDRLAGAERDFPDITVFRQRIRFVRRAVLAAVWTLLCAATQSVLLVLPGTGKRALARLYWAGVCRLFGIERRVLGERAPPGRPVLFACNHTSWLDVPVLGGTLPACFVAKSQVGTWPVIRMIARLGRTVFVSRKPGETVRERDGMRARLVGGDNLILFPEGTSSDGTRVLPFRSPFFAVVEAGDGEAVPLIQPVSVVFDRLDYLPARRSTRPVTSWYGDMELGSHFWRLARHRHFRATVVLHEPLDPTPFGNRKALAKAVQRVVIEGNAALRQGRSPATPL